MEVRVVEVVREYARHVGDAARTQFQRGDFDVRQVLESYVGFGSQVGRVPFRAADLSGHGERALDGLLRFDGPRIFLIYRKGRIDRGPHVVHSDDFFRDRGVFGYLARCDFHGLDVGRLFQRQHDATRRQVDGRGARQPFGRDFLDGALYQRIGYVVFDTPCQHQRQYAETKSFHSFLQVRLLGS